MLKFLKWLGNGIFKNDPVYHCKTYKQDGCAHVDGFLCDGPECEGFSKAPPKVSIAESAESDWNSNKGVEKK